MWAGGVEEGSREEAAAAGQVALGAQDRTVSGAVSGAAGSHCGAAAAAYGGGLVGAVAGTGAGSGGRAATEGGPSDWSPGPGAGRRRGTGWAVVAAGVERWRAGAGI